MHSFSIFSIIGYYKMLNMVPCAIDPCHLSILYIVAYISLSQTTCVFFSPLTSGQTVSVKDQIVYIVQAALTPLRRLVSAVISGKHPQTMAVGRMCSNQSVFLFVAIVCFLVTQTVKSPPAMQETWYRSLGWEDPLEEGMVTYSSVPAWRITMDRGAWRATVHVAKSQIWLSD